MGEIKGQLLGITAVIVTFGIISSALFLAFDTLANDLADDVTDTITYKQEAETLDFDFDKYDVSINSTTTLLSF